MLERFPRRAHALRMTLGFLLAAACGKEGKSASRVAGGSIPQRGTVTRRQNSSQSCDTAGGVFCFRDTAYGGMGPGDPVPRAGADWIWFGSAGDSIEVVGPEGSYISTNLGAEHDADHDNVSYFHQRLATDGILATRIDFLNIGDTVPYELRIRRQGPETHTALIPTGKWARLTIVSVSATDPFTVIPLSLVRSVKEGTKWKVMALPYNVALVGDSLYQICKVPCVSPDTVKLAPSGRATRRYLGRCCSRLTTPFIATGPRAPEMERQHSHLRRYVSART